MAKAVKTQQTQQVPLNHSVGQFENLQPNRDGNV